MKRINKLAASVAVALSLGVMNQANALIELEANSTGDALLFPVFYGYGENYFTIMNNDDNWIQGHLRFRGAVWCGELLDMDIILSPGDVFVFRLADIDGDGFWEIDQSLDPKNFAYTGMISRCGPELADGTTPVLTMDNCMDQSSILIPKADNNDTPPGNITDGKIIHHRNMGQVEFIAEGMFLPYEGITKLLSTRMGDFINPDNAGTLSHLGQRKAGDKTGTHLWSWVNGDQAYPDADTTLGSAVVNGFEHQDDAKDEQDGSDTNGKNEERWTADVGNVLSGTAFLTQAGDSSGLAYNADALVNFRTDTHGVGSHRVENYPDDIAVILHHEDSIANNTPQNYAYAYSYDEYSNTNQIQNFEARISFNNTWGPTLADGDDYNQGSVDGDWLATVENFVDNNSDAWDEAFAKLPNSLVEVNAAVRTAGSDFARQDFTSFYMDSADFDKSGKSSSTLSSWYFAFAPTKFYSGEDNDLWFDTVRAKNDAGYQKNNTLLGKSSYLTAAVNHLINAGKQLNLEVWDIFENTPMSPTVDTPTCDRSPCLPEKVAGVISSKMVIADQVAAFSIDNVKNKFGSGGHQDWDAGRVVMKVNPLENKWCDGGISNACPQNYSIMMYTFDWSSEGALSHWRPMHR